MPAKIKMQEKVKDKGSSEQVSQPSVAPHGSVSFQGWSDLSKLTGLSLNHPEAREGAGNRKERRAWMQAEDQGTDQSAKPPVYEPPLATMSQREDYASRPDMPYDPSRRESSDNEPDEEEEAPPPIERKISKEQFIELISRFARGGSSESSRSPFVRAEREGGNPRALFLADHLARNIRKIPIAAEESDEKIRELSVGAISHTINSANRDHRVETTDGYQHLRAEDLEYIFGDMIPKFSRVGDSMYYRIGNSESADYYLKVIHGDNWEIFKKAK